MIKRLVMVLLLSGQFAAAGLQAAAAKGFDFTADTLAFPNELGSEYDWDARGKMIRQAKAPKPEFTLRCFAVARIARQFLQHARFEPNEPKATPASYRHWIDLILARSPRAWSEEPSRIVIPGYASLREFSADQETFLKARSGSAVRSYFQRGNWRMVLPFSRRHQERTAANLLADLQRARPPIVHVVNFPSLALNHAVLLFDGQTIPGGIAFSTYDPNDPDRPGTLLYRHAQRRFEFSRTEYFLGGPVNVYEIYCSALY